MTWKERRVQELADLINGFPFDSSDFAPVGDVPLVRIRDILSSPFETFVPAEVVPQDALIVDGDVVIGMDGDFNVVHWDRGSAALNQRLCILRANGSADTRFLAYALPAHLKVINDLTYATTVKHLSSGQVRAIRMAAPPLDAQRAIADYLDRETARIDTLITEQRRLIEMLQERRAAVGERAVGELEWATPLRSLASLIQTGPFGSQLKSDEYVPGGTPVINPSHMVGGSVEPDARVAVSPEKAAELARHAMCEGDLVVARRGELGRCAVVRHSQIGYLCGTGSALVRLDRAAADPDFIALVFGSRRNRDALSLASVGSTMDNLNASIIAALRVPLPPLAQQQLISHKVAADTRKIDNLIGEGQRLIELAQERRAALITAAVTGQIDVREAA